MYEQIKLPYATDALEPYIDKETVETHHGKHHATYTKNFNDLAEKAGIPMVRLSVMSLTDCSRIARKCWPVVRRTPVWVV